MCSRQSSPSEKQPAAQADLTAPRRVAAFFDVDGTLLDGNIVHAYAAVTTHGMSTIARAIWTIRFALWVPLFLLVDGVSRSAFNRLFYRHYRGLDANVIESAAIETFKRFALPRLAPRAHEAVRRHQEAGHYVALVSGTTSFIARPLADYLGVDNVFSVDLEVRRGRFTGRLNSPPLSDERKADVVRDFAEKRDVDLTVSYAYGDSAADLAMLRAVGYPVAVNPSRRLHRIALAEGWRIEHWSREQTGRRP